MTQFRNEVAQQVYERLAKMAPEEAAELGRLIVAEGLAHDLAQTDLAKAYVEFQASHVEQVKKNLVRSYVSKSRSGQNVDTVVAAVEAVAKAYNQNWAPQLHPRDPNTGRFVVGSHQIQYTRGAGTEHDQAHAQIHQLIAPYRNLPPGMGELHVQYANGVLSSDRLPGPGEPVDLDPNATPLMAHVSVRSPFGGMPQDQTRVARTFDVVNALTNNPQFAAHLANQQVSVPTNQYNAAESFNPGQRHLRRLKTGADLVNQLGGPYLPTHARVATGVASFVGQYGPQAQQVFGPTMDKAKYRYTGTERKLDPQLKEAINQVRQDAVLSHPGYAQAKKDLKVAEATYATHEKAAQNAEFNAKQAAKTARSAKAPTIRAKARKDAAAYTQQAKRENERAKAAYTAVARAKDKVDNQLKAARSSSHEKSLLISSEMVRGREVRTPSPVIQYFREHLPKKNLSFLQRASGQVPPSEGIIIDRDGDVSTQMVGRGDDWYLPFDLRNLKALNGGEYIRTRSYGGLTTEDIYTGLMSGARSMTVVSRNGVYTMEFDDALRGSRRYSADARKMTERYGQLLDAVQSKAVTGNDIDPTVVAQIKDEAAALHPPAQNYPAYEAEVERRMKAAREHPKPSNAMLGDWTMEWLDAKAAEMGLQDRDALLGSVVNQIANTEKTEDEAKMAGTGVKLPGIEEYRTQVRNRFNDPGQIGQLIKLTGDAEGYNAYINAKAKDYARSLKALELNGPGYDLAAKALKEQFPYYIKDARWQPWQDDEEAGATDHGYIKPRFNRPAEVKSGYFDDTILGHGKKRGDQTRYQNYAVMQNRGSAEASQTPPAAPAAPTTPGGPTNPAGPAPVTPTAQLPVGIQGQAANAAAGIQTPPAVKNGVPQVGPQQAQKSPWAISPPPPAVLQMPRSQKTLAIITGIQNSYPDPNNLMNGGTAAVAVDETKPLKDQQIINFPPEFKQDPTVLDSAGQERLANRLRMLNRRFKVAKLTPDMKVLLATDPLPVNPAEMQDAHMDLPDQEYALGPEYARGRTSQQYLDTAAVDPQVLAAQEYGMKGGIALAIKPGKSEHYQMVGDARSLYQRKIREIQRNGGQTSQEDWDVLNGLLKIQQASRMYNETVPGGGANGNPYAPPAGPAPAGGLALATPPTGPLNPGGASGGTMVLRRRV